tara:strand:+ start:390 stop:1262 length:873 start_codon:yes stop_codon:yes gene_type:complete
MKLFDCTTYHNEDLILEARFNILNKHFDKFIVCEAKFTHSGKEKKLNFNIKKFTEFKKKIIYLVQDNEPSDLSPDNKLNKRSNAIKRVACQRNKLAEGLSNADSNDLIFYSDNDEIPDLKNVNLETINKKIIIFEQKLFYYKFNLYLDRIHWYGTRALRKKNLRTFELLREIKPKKYSFYRIDTLFNEKKFIDLHVVKNGGWHFTRILSPQEIHSRELETEHSDEYLESKKDSKKIEDLIRRKVIDHDHLADKRENKFGEEFDLKPYPVKHLPDYIENNQIKYKNYLDLE